MPRNIKMLFLIFFDSFIIFIAHIISYFFLYPLINIPQKTFFFHIFVVTFIYIIFGLLTKTFGRINRFTSTQEVVSHTIIIISSFILGTFVYNLYDPKISFRYVSFAFLIAVLFIPISRLTWRGWTEYGHRLKSRENFKDRKTIRTLLIGAGEAGALYVKALRNRSDIKILGFLDDDKNKQGTVLHGYPVIGKIAELESVATQYNIKQITIAIPSLSQAEMNKIVDIAKKLNVRTNQMPYIEDVIAGDNKIDEFQDIEVTDLLGRDEVELDTYSIKKQISKKTVLVSGAGGSIGSEICRQIAKYSPSKIVLVGHGEYSIYSIERELRKNPENTFEIIPVIADIQDKYRIFEVLREHKPDIVYHAAAHKHVPLMELNPREAVKNNVLGTKNIAEASKEANVESFVMISTDKAVNPPNVMGATKRIAEMIVTGLNEEGETNFVAVRFGNVLNSSGSVIPVFKEQIEKGGPITVTDFRMTRYFMTIPEASRLVMQAGVMAKGGEIFVLDMGEPVKILDLAKQMIWLSGHSEEEIDIVESGIRPGEKLYEELLASDENTEEKVFDKIFVGKVHNLPLNVVYSFIDSLDDLVDLEFKRKLISFANNTYDENLSEFHNLF